MNLTKQININTYPAYKDSGVEWLGMIPEKWEARRVKSIFRLIAESAPKDNNYELLSVYTDIGVKPRKELEERGNRASSTDGYWRVKKGDVIVNKLLAWMGAIGISNYDGVTSPAYDILRAFKLISGSYFHNLFRLPSCVSELKRHSRGIMDMRLRLYFDKFGDVIVPFPPIEEQTAIATYLDNKTAKIEKAIAQKERLIELLKERKQIMIQNAVTKGLNPNAKMKDSGVEWIGEIPEHWEVKKLKMIASHINRGVTPDYVEFSNNKVINQATFSKGFFDFNNIKFSKVKDIKKGRVKRDDILLASTGGGVLGKVGFIDFDGNSYFADSHVTILRGERPHFYSKFYFYFLAINFDLINGVLSQGSTNQTELQRDWLRNFSFPVPVFSEQEEIVFHIETQSKKIDRAITLQKQQIEKLKEYKSVLIDSAVTGKIKVF